MRYSPFDTELTKLLVQAKVHHMRVMMETLPVGMISITANGAIEQIDEWTEKLLCFSGSELKGLDITILLHENSPEFLGRIETLTESFSQPIVLRAKNGTRLHAHAAVNRDESALHRAILSLAFIQLDDEDDNMSQIA